jgi:predicted flavoprotein YhiN
VRRAGTAWLDYVLDPRGDDLDRDLQDQQRARPHLALRTWLAQRLPERLCVPALQDLGLPPDQRLHDLSRAGRKAAVALLRAFPLGQPRAVDLERGEVSAGGVLLAGVDPATMAVKGWDNLRVCGELLDIDGPVGGYNLQAAFSTGYAAGNLA